MTARDAALAWGLAPLMLAGLANAPAPPRARLEDAYRANNRGVAFLEQFEPERAAAEFRRALELSPGLGLARANLAIALLNLPKLDAARDEARAAAAVLPDAPQPHYVLGLAARGLGDPEAAQGAFRRVLEIDPSDVGAHINLGQLHLQAGRYAEAVTEFRAALVAESYNATATYNLGLALTRSGQTEEGVRTMERFRQLREAGYGTVLGQSYPDQGRYAEAMASTGAEVDLVDAATPPVRFVDATARWLSRTAVRLPGARATAVDLDGDGDLDVHLVGPSGQRLLLNKGGALADVTTVWKLDPARGGTGAVAGDVDNDGRPDLLVVGTEGVGLYLNRDGGFTPAAADAGLPTGTVGAAALVDADHDGDLDVVLVGGAPTRDRLLQNDGAARFKDVSDAAGLGKTPGSTVVVPTDFDDRRDVDLLFAGGRAAPRLFRNLRDGTFREIAAETGLPREAGSGVVAAADVTKDGRTDFFFAGDGTPGILAASTGRSGFTPSAAPPALAGARQALFLDYDNDGLLDLVAATPQGWRVVRNIGSAGWKDVTEPAIARGTGMPATFTAGDLDGDGDLDLLAVDQDGALRVLENREGRHGALRVRLAGRVSNRSAVGAKVDVRAGSLRQRMETSAATPPVAPASVVFGLGRRASADAVRVLWPAGILQTELVTPEKSGARTALAIEELDRKPSSCPYLYAWDGARFSFVTDFLGGGEMGYWVAPGTFNQPDPDEYVRITDAQLRARSGRLELRVTNELEEALFVDRLALLAFDHPADVEIHPDEALRRAAPRYRVLSVGDLRETVAATDGRGHDVRDRLSRLDRVFVDDFPKARFRGYAAEHALTLDLGKDAGEDAVLLLTGWTDYAFSSDNVAAQQAGVAMEPPRLEVEIAAGTWRTVHDDVGIPVGRPQTILVEMKGRWYGPSRRVRLVTNMRIYWDQVRVGRTAGLPREPARLDAARADLTERGFSAESSPDGREPFSYDYARVSAAPPWKVFPGRYTRPGDVRELLAAVDDVFVLSPPGDEIALSFDAAALPALPTGWRRTYLLHSDGFSKEMNLRSATPDDLGPLPFHGMPSYPYTAPVRYPMTPEKRALWERYATREVRGPVPSLETSLAREER